MYLLVIHCLQTVHLMQEKICSIIKEAKDCMKNFCLNLKEHATKIINYEKTKKK